MAEIKSTNGFSILLDDEDAELIGTCGWFADESRNTRYARRWRLDGDRERMHNLITGWPLVDHVNGNGLDNRRINLRPATASQNAMNRRMRSDNTSGFKGVTWDKSHRKWSVRIWVDGKNLSLGHFDDLAVAASAYDCAAIQHFGEFAWTNSKQKESA